MRAPSDIRYVRRKDLDSGKWDACVQSSPNGMIYAYSFYLDKMARHWDALIMNDYECIMPMVWNRKWGIRYLYQPPFTQQLGICAREPLTRERVDQFLELVSGQFRFAEINLNFENQSSRQLVQRENFVLDLNKPYEELFGQYKQDLHKNLRHAAQFNLDYSDRVDLKYTLRKFKETYEDRTPQIRPNHYSRFEKLCAELMVKDMILLRSIHANDDEILATALVLKDKNRLYLIQSTVTPMGRKRGANHLLLDRIIREFSEQPLILDFEGSDIPGIAHFYKNFGSENQPYAFFRFNQLPWPLKLLKEKPF